MQFNKSTFNAVPFNGTGQNEVTSAFASKNATASQFDGIAVSGAYFSSNIVTAGKAAPAVFYFVSAASQTATVSEVRQTGRMIASLHSTTRTLSTYDMIIEKIASFSSSSRFDSTILGAWIRTYKHDPQKYNRSEPIFIYDRNEDLQLVLSDDGIVYKDGWMPEQLNGEQRLEFSVLANSPEVAAIQNDGRAVVRDIDGDYREFIIRVIDDADSGSSFKTIQAEGAEYELIDEFLASYVQPNVDLEIALSAVLQGTRWQIGQIENFWDLRSVDLRNMTVKEAVYQLVKQFGGEVAYRVEVKGNRIVARYIDVFQKRGRYTGKRFETGRDIISTSRILDSTVTKTALYGLGASGEDDGPRLTFGDVTWSKAAGDPIDKPLGQTWIGDDNALAVWGYNRGTRHKFGFYDGQEEDPAELLLSTWNELQRLTKLNETYEINVVHLGELMGYEPDRVRLGDTAFAINRNIYPHVEVEVSIIEFRHNLNDKRLSEVTLGDYRNAYDLAGRFNDIQKDVNDKQGNWSKKPNSSDVKREAQNEATRAIAEAQIRIDQAKQELQTAVSQIAQGKIGLTDARWLIQDTIDNPQNYKGQMMGDLIADSLLLRGSITAINATITGNLLAEGTTIMSAAIEKANIIDANIQNARITGQLDGVNGTFVGDLIGARIMSGSTIDVTTDLYVGNNIYLGKALAGTKRIVFNEWASISAIDDNITIDGSTLRVDSGNGTAELVKHWKGTQLQFYYSAIYKSAVYQDNSDRHRLKLETSPGNGIWIDPATKTVYFMVDGLPAHSFYASGAVEHKK